MENLSALINEPLKCVRWRCSVSNVFRLKKSDTDKLPHVPINFEKFTSDVCIAYYKKQLKAIKSF